MGEVHDRRNVLKKAATLGAIAWTAPVVLSFPASAAAACTPKCLPVGTPHLTASTIDVCLNHAYRVTVTLTVTPGSVTCPCGGVATVIVDGSTSGNTIVILRPKGFRGPVTENFTATVSCVDGTGDTCSTGNCSGQISFTIIGNPGNDCAQNRVVGETVSIVC